MEQKMVTLKDLRKDAGLTQQDLANLVSLAVPVSRATVAVWETGNRCPEYPAIKRLAEIFIKPIEEIYEIFYPKTVGEK